MNEFDDVDRLFRRGLDRMPVPDDVTARVLASTVARRDATRAVLAWPWMVAGLTALAVLTLAGYQLGATVVRSDALELLGSVFDDVGLLTTAPGDVVAALGEVIPWSLIALGGVSAGLVILAAGHVLSWSPRAAAASDR